MSAQEFAYWLQGYFELTPDGGGLSPEQVKVVKDHLQLVFQKVTPVVDIPPPMFTPCVVDLNPNTRDFVPIAPTGGEWRWHLHDVADAERIRNEYRNCVVGTDPQALTMEEVKQAILLNWNDANGKPPASC